MSSPDLDEDFRSGFVAVVGRPNVGKSTLVNALVGAKVSIVFSRPETTRRAIRGVINAESAQAVLVDTPGFHKPRTLLGERLNEVVREVWSDVDLALLVVDAASGIGRGDEWVAREIPSHKTTFLVANKIDLISRGAVAEALVRASKLKDFQEIIPVSARTGEGVGELRRLILESLPSGPMYFPPGMPTDLPPPLFVAELVREKLLNRMQEKLPHSIAVVTDSYEERSEGLLVIEVSVYVERPSQKAIVIGRGGSVLKAVGTAARREIETLFGRRVYLELKVKVEKDWQRRASALERLGFG